MADSNVIPFRRVGFEIMELQTIMCGYCDSRAMRLVSNTGDDEFQVECHNCGELVDGLKVKWQDSGTT